MPKRLISFGAWDPDSSRYGEDRLKGVEGLLPLYRGWRPLRKKVQVAKATDAAVTGAHAHYYQQTLMAQFLRPDADVSNSGAWIDFAGGSVLYTQIDESTANDGDGIYSPPAASAAQCVIRLSDANAPGATTGHNIRWRYIVEETTGAWTVQMELLEGSTVIATDTATGSGVAAWTERLYTLSGAEAGAITDYTDLSVRFTGTVAGSAQIVRPDADDSVGGWTTHVGGVSALYTMIDEAVVDDADLIRSAVISVGGTSTYRAVLGNAIDPISNTGHVLRYRYRALNSGMTVTVRLKQGTTTIASATHASAPTTLTTATLTLSATEAALITDYEDLRVEVEGAFPSLVASTIEQEAAPASDQGSNSTLQPYYWTPGGSPAGGFAEGVDADDSAFVAITTKAMATSATVFFEVGLSAVTDPQVHTGHVVRVLCSSTPTRTIPFELRQGATVIASFSLVVNSTSSYREYTLSEAEAAAISNYGDLRLWVGDPGGVGPEIDRAYLSVPQPRRVEVTWVEFEVPAASRIGISWLEMEVPDPASTFLSDKIVLYAGTNEALYEVDSAGFTDVSLAGGYATGTVNPVSWDFATFGDQVIATNKVDEVQIRGPADATYVDMITSPSPAPKARFVEVVRNQVALLDINLTGAYADEVWFSDQDDATNFTTGGSSLALRQRLLHLPGQINGGVGGEWLTIFKGNGILRMNFVGAGLGIYDVQVLSSHIGTWLPKSIVKAGNDIYFRGPNSFCVLRDGIAVDENVGMEVMKFLGDFEFSADAIRQTAPEDPRLTDQVVSGAYDSASRVALWFYYGNEDTTQYKKTRFVAYDTRLQRWGFGRIPDPGCSLVISKPNTPSTDGFAIKQIIGFDWDSAEVSWFQFSGTTTYAAELKTQVMKLVDDPKLAGRNVIVLGVRPVFDFDTTDGVWPELTISVRSGELPSLLDEKPARSFSTNQAGRNGYVGVHQSGEWWEFTVSIPEAQERLLREFVGLEVDYKVEGV